MDRALDHILDLLYSARLPELPPELADNKDVANIHAYLAEMRRQLGNYARGDFSCDISQRGPLAGMLKALQANMLHLVWQLRQIESGDFSQRIDFMGEFSIAFNKMAQRLSDALSDLKQKEEQLRQMAQNLEVEVEKRGAALAALQKSEENFKYMAEHDPLTGLLNRRSFFAQAEMQLARAAIMSRPCCLALMDIDHFKQVNDTLGHLHGDEALRHIAKIGSSALRTNDIMGRFGGEEFVYLFPQASTQQGKNAAERIRRLIADNPVNLGGKAVTVTASFGVVSIPPKHQKSEINFIDFALGLADSALSDAKAGGRNRVVVTEFPPE